ncbi:PREDICTED: anoctamin-7 [Miniopterus natalensis]|uniref:anoctamin-7 n=1 Tax=Miniopterus natalensis TaxID=291302 RepID=UPI0007A6AA63|nr:PREDICTED: anoctamin-7 [Miniopterus natalensis]
MFLRSHTQEMTELVLPPGSPDVLAGTAPSEDDSSPPVAVQLNPASTSPSMAAAGLPGRVPPEQPAQTCCSDQAPAEASSGSHCTRSRMLRRRAPEEDSAVLINMAPGMEKGDSYGSIFNTSQTDEHQAATHRAGSPAKPRIADFVLVWEEDLRLGEQQDSTTQDKTETHRAWRETFLDNLRVAGLHVDQRHVQDEGSVVHHVLLSASWAVLCYYAEDLRLKLPLQELPNQACNWSASLLQRLGVPNVLLEDVPDMPPEYYSCQFKVSKLSRFLHSDSQDSFFTSTNRHQILFEILAKTPYGHEKKGLFGVDQLLSQGVFKAAFPLHEGPFMTPPEDLHAPGLSQRQILFQYWARWRKWHKYQPLDHVRRYFGEKVAFYFAWLGFYTGWLLPAAVVGTLVFLVGCFMVFSDTPTQELCSSADSFEMCPLCLNCPFWLLSSACSLVQAGRLFDHGGTVFFSVFMALWAVLFLEYWKRKSATLAYRWGCFDYEDIEERPRPQFAASAPTTALNPVTGEEEPHFPRRSRMRRTLAGSVLVLMMVAAVVMCFVSITVYRTTMAILVSRSNNTLLATRASRIASLTGSMVNLVFILTISKVYVALAHVLTRWEMHRTQTSFEDAFTLKVFIFQFVNFYSSPIYIGFFKGRFVGYPGNYHTLFGVRNEECAAGGCLIELAQELLVIMVGKQIINNMQEMLVPKLKGRWLRSKKGKVASAAVGQAPWEADYELLPYEGLFDEYLEMARPTIIGSGREKVEVLRSHLPGSPHQVHVSCRYRAFRDHDGHYSGTYWNLLAIRLAFVIVFEHVVFSIGRVLDLLVPDIPESVQIKVKREYYLAKQALAENETLFGTNGAKDDPPQSSAESLGPQPRWPEASRASPVPSL